MSSRVYLVFVHNELTGEVRGRPYDSGVAIEAIAGNAIIGPEAAEFHVKKRCEERALIAAFHDLGWRKTTAVSSYPMEAGEAAA